MPKDWDPFGTSAIPPPPHLPPFGIDELTEAMGRLSVRIPSSTAYEQNEMPTPPVMPMRADLGKIEPLEEDLRYTAARIKSREARVAALNAETAEKRLAEIRAAGAYWMDENARRAAARKPRNYNALNWLAQEEHLIAERFDKPEWFGRGYRGNSEMLRRS